MASDFFESKKAERKTLLLDATYEWEGIKAPCEILDISSKGLRLRVKGCLYTGDKIKIYIDKFTFPSLVLTCEGNIANVNFEDLTEEKLSFLLKIK